MSSTAMITAEGSRYPPPLASHDDVVKDPTLFWDTLRNFHSQLGTKYMVPVIGGKELNLHVLYVEVTNRGGYDKVVSEKKWREIGSVFKFSATTTSASYALRKHYSSLLHHYEQVYFFKLQGPLISTSSTAIGTIDGKFDCGYLVSVKVGSEILNGVLYYPGQPGSSSMSTSQPCTAIIPYTAKHAHSGRRSRRRRGGDPNRPKPNRSGYNFFFAEKHSMLKSLYPEREREFTKMIGESWTNLSQEERMVYQNHGLKDKERYQREMKEYKERIKLRQQKAEETAAEEEREPDTKSVAVVSRSRSQATTRTTTAAVEKLLPNGDLYTGSFSGNAPHGSGKYLWTDGCMYEGEWKRGKASGKGKFSWSSGATFEGDFKSGRMDGFGTFIGSDADTYRGSWVADRKHGHGQKRYTNGDFYDGLWRRNLQDGHGRYVWKNGNEYVGEWRNGVINGRGMLIWSNGNRYDGNWENGVPKGNGVFTWPDGSCYIGSWSKESGNTTDSKNPQQQILNGTFYPGNNTSIVGNDHKRQSLTFNHKIDDNCVMVASTATKKRSSVERAFPRICIWESDGEAGDITCDIIDNVEASMFYRDGKGWGCEEIKQFRRGPCCFTGGEVKKPGLTISKGHKNYDLMLNLQLGIRYSVGKHASILRDLKPSDFDPKEKFWTRFPSEGSKVTPPHQSWEFRWKDYCPMVFRHLRELFQVDPADYMLAICGNDALRELSSPGKSGSFFYLTQDDRFMIKTVKKSEVKVLIKMLPSYYQHVCRYENSLVTKFFGVHCVKPAGGLKTRFIVMGNLFCSEYQIHRRFDLKGSSHGRTTNKPEGEIDETTTLKDLDLNFVFRIQGNWFQELIKQIDRDCQFLEAERIMDYSLLVGLHFRDDNTGDKMGLSPFMLRTGKKDSFQNEKFMRGCRFLEAELQDMDRVLAGRKPLIRLGANMPARAERVARRSDFDQYSPGGFSNLTPSRNGEIYEVVLYFGIIDILQDYDISKKLEHAYKSLQADPTSISAVDPKLYSKRFRDFVGRIFVEDR